MFDRILQLINTAAAEGVDRQLADDTVTLYLKKGASATEQFLVQEKALPQDQATALLLRIDRENNRLNRQALFINLLFIGGGLLGVLSGFLVASYFFILMGVVITAIAARNLPKNIRRMQAPRYRPGTA